MSYDRLIGLRLLETEQNAHVEWADMDGVERIDALCNLEASRDAEREWIHMEEFVRDAQDTIDGKRRLLNRADCEVALRAIAHWMTMRHHESRYVEQMVALAEGQGRDA